MFICKIKIDNQPVLCTTRYNLDSKIFDIPSCREYYCIVYWKPYLDNSISESKMVTLLKIMKDNDFYSYYSIIGSFYKFGVSWRYNKENHIEFFRSIWPIKGLCFWNELFLDWWNCYYIHSILFEPILSYGFYQLKVQETISAYSKVNFIMKKNQNQNRLAAMIFYIYKMINYEEIEKKKIYIRDINNWESLIQNNDDLNREFNIIKSSSNIREVWYEMLLYLCSINLRFSINNIVYIYHFNKWEKGTILKSKFINDNKMRLYLVKLDSNSKEIFVEDDDKSSISLNNPMETINYIEKADNSLNLKIDSPKSVQQNMLSERNKRICKVCYEEESSFIYIPCGHLCICSTCKDKILNRSIKCPMCNQSGEIYKVYN